jgi:hypothetical protein
MLATIKIDRAEAGMTVTESGIVAQALPDFLFCFVEPGGIVRIAGLHRKEVRESVFGPRFAEEGIQVQGTLQQLPAAGKIECPYTEEEFGFGEIPG